MKQLIVLLSVFSLIMGCATVKPVQKRMLPGKIYSLTDGTEMSFSIEMATNSGEMSAYNPKTSETFTGNTLASLQEALFLNPQQLMPGERLREK